MEGGECVPLREVRDLSLSRNLLREPFNLMGVGIRATNSDKTNRTRTMLATVSGGSTRFVRRTFSTTGGGPSRVRATLRGQRIVCGVSHNRLLLLTSASNKTNIIVSTIFTFIFRFRRVLPCRGIFTNLRKFVTGKVMFIDVLIFVIFFVT